MPPDLPLLFAGAPKLGLGLYNAIGAVHATVLELGMLGVAAVAYARFVERQRKKTHSLSR